MMCAAKKMSDGIIVAILGALSTVAGGIIVYLASRKKNQADAADAVTDAALALINPLKDRLAELEAKVKKQENEIANLRRQLDRYADRIIVLMRGIENLIKQIGELGGKPCWEPDEWSGSGDDR
jgi:septal ring factor EnvC (AmiA/AmiB activator)